MPLDLIDVGTNPNDGTGTLNRAAWQKVNDMLTEVYALLGNTVDLTTFGDSLNDTAAAVATIQTDMADKVSSATLLSYTLLSQIIRGDASAALTLTYRRQAAINAGNMVTLCIPLIDETTFIDSDAHTQGLFDITLPRFPKDFSIIDAFLTCKLFPTPITNTFAFTVAMQHLLPSSDYIAIIDNVNMDDQGRVPFDVIAAESLIAGGRDINMVVQVDRLDFGTGTGKGLDLWLRGVWKN